MSFCSGSARAICSATPLAHKAMRSLGSAIVGEANTTHAVLLRMQPVHD
jgi:hypothetical protein